MEKMVIGVIVSVGEDPAEGLNKARTLGIKTVQLGTPPPQYFSGERKEALKQAIEKTGIVVTTVFCGFIGESYRDIPTIQRTVGLVNPAFREERVKRTLEIADFAKDLGVDKVAAHIGFIPEDTGSPLYKELVEALRKVADHCRNNGQSFCLETGQEKAEALLRFIKAVGRDNIRVNFDPANMVLYGTGNPIEALDILKDYVVGVHCKDGKWPTVRGQLGWEVPLGQGDVGIERFIKKLKEIGYEGPLTIEREITGEQQVKDVMEAKKLLERLRM